MKRALTFVLALVFAISFTACEKAPFVTMTGPRSYTFTREGGTQSFAFSCNRDWIVSSTESWIRVSPTSGKASDGDITVTITCSPNTTYDPRTATITVKVEELSETLTVTQETGIGLIVSPTTFDLTNAAQDIEIELQKNVQYSVAIDESGVDWIKQGGTKALSTDKVTFHISENKDYDGREGKITFKQTDGPLSETVIVRQSQMNGLFITTSTYDLSNEAHTLSVEVKANVEFQVTSQADWIKYVETKGLVASNITLSIEANESYDNRTGTVLVKQTNGDLSGTITINQHQTDGLFVTPTSAEVSNQANTVTLEIKDNVNYNVVIPDHAKSWISVRSNTQTKALKDDQVVLAIAANTTYDDREASVTVKQVNGPLAETVKIKQAYGEGLIPEKTTYDIGQEGGSIEVAIQANVEYEVTPEVDWIHYIETKALSGSTVTLTVDENDLYSAREGSVSIKKKEGPLSASITIRQAKKIAVESVTIDNNELFIEVGKTYKLNASISPSSATVQTVTWTSSDENIATVDDKGTVKGIGRGKVTISAVAEDKKGTCPVYVDCIPDDEIWYTTIDEKPLIFQSYNWGAMPEIISNVYSAGKVRMRLKSAPPELTERAFADQYNLKTIILPETITALGWGSFNECNNLESISLPGNLKTIGANAFGVCESLKEVTLPDSVDSIAEGAFSGCTSLAKINSKLAKEDGRTIVVNGILVAVAWAGLSSYEVPDGVTRIGNSVFSHFSHMGSQKLKSVTLPNGLKSIGTYAFQEAPITSIVIPDSVESIESAAFCFCWDLASATISSKLKIIESNVFDGCHSLSSITLPSQIERIESNSFSGTSLNTIVIPEAVTFIGHHAFSECSSLESIYLRPINPPVLEIYYSYSDPFNNTNCPIYVPSESITSYQTANIWKDYYLSRLQPY